MPDPYRHPDERCRTCGNLPCNCTVTMRLEARIRALEEENARLRASEKAWRDSLGNLCVRLCGQETANRSRWVADIEGVVERQRDALARLLEYVDGDRPSSPCPLNEVYRHIGDMIRMMFNVDAKAGGR